MREFTPPPPSDDEDDPWAFVTARNPRASHPSLNPLIDAAVPELTEPAAAGSRLADAGDESASQALRRRARPLAWAVAAAFFFGFITEVVAAARFVYLLGPSALVIIYIFGGLSLVAVALLQMTWIDRLPRNKAFIRVTLAYGITVIVAIALIATTAGPHPRHRPLRAAAAAQGARGSWRAAPRRRRSARRRERPQSRARGRAE